MLIVDLLSIAVVSTSSGELELVRLAHDTAIFVTRAIMSVHDTVNVSPTVSAVTTGEAGLMQRILMSLDAHSQHTSWRVRETAMKCLSILMANNWPSLTTDQRKVRLYLIAHAYVFLIWLL